MVASSTIRLIGVLARPCFILLGSLSVTIGARNLFAESREDPATTSVRHAAILRDERPMTLSAAADRLGQHFVQKGWSVRYLSLSDVVDSSTLDPTRIQLLVIPDCRSYPAAGWSPLEKYARHGGRVLFLGGPFLDRPLWQHENRWLDRGAILASRTALQPRHRPLPISELESAKWLHNTNDRSAAGSWTVTEGPEPDKKAYRFATTRCTGWDGYLSPSVAPMFGAGDDLFLFLAKGDRDTPQVAVEIQEEDGSRWIATVDITTKWQRYALGTTDFSFWPDSPSGKRRGRTGDRLHTEKARRVNFQIAQSHTVRVGQGAHTFWIADLGTCADPYEGLMEKVDLSSRSWETLFPRYKVFSIAGPFGLEPSANVLSTTGVPESAVIQNPVCAVPRTMGRGFRRGQPWRFVALYSAIDDQGRERGHPVWLLLDRRQTSQTGLCACIGANESRDWTSPAGLKLIDEVSDRLFQGLLLSEGGTEHFSYWPGEAIRIGASALNLGHDSRAITLRARCLDGGANVVATRAQKHSLAPDESFEWSFLLPPSSLPKGDYEVQVELIWEDRILDTIGHSFEVLDTTKPDPAEFMTTSGSNFRLHGKAWNPVGVNYWPLYVSGMDYRDYSSGWMQRKYYAPELIEDDLRRMDELGINLVSIQSNDPRFYRNLRDFLHRCRRHNIYVNLFCGLASPLAFKETALRQFIETARLRDCPTIIAYDTIWEPGNYVFRRDWRPRWNSAWRAWIVEQYGSLESAEADWRTTAPRNEEGQVTSPSDRQLREDGPWRVMVAAYRRFMDDLTSRRWNRAHRALRRIDPHHLISFRQGNTLPHDFVFTGTPKHIDFICPEGYAIPATAAGQDASGFITKYVHFTTRGKPIVWSEFGLNAWDLSEMRPSPDRLQEMADYHEQFYRMVLEAGANGTIPWWWPGGFREGERSDYGIIERDGLPRAAAELMLTYGPRIRAGRDWPEANAWFDMDRDAHAGGYWHIAFHSGSEAYREARKAGRHLGIRTVGTGTNSATTPRLAIGNRPLTDRNPPKFLNAEFNWVRIQDVNGHWVEVAEGATIRVKRDAPVLARVCVGNTQESEWIAPSGSSRKTGDVVLQTTTSSETNGTWPLPANTDYLEDADFGTITLCAPLKSSKRVELRMSAVGCCSFGERRRFVLQP